MSTCKSPSAAWIAVRMFRPAKSASMRPQLAAHLSRELVQFALSGDREQAVGTGADAQRLDERYLVRLASLAIGDPHVAELARWMTQVSAVALSGARLGALARARPPRRTPSCPCRRRSSRAGPRRRSIRTSGRRPVPRPATRGRSRTDTCPISTICGCEPQSAFPRRTRSATTEIEGSTSSSNAPLDRERPPEQLCDEGLDAALVPAQVAEGEVKNDRENDRNEQASRGGEDDDGEAAK